MFLKTNRRIEGLITVICLALLIFWLIEGAVRAAIRPDTTMTGLSPGQNAKPTGRLIFHGRPPDDPRQRRPARDHLQPTPVQVRLLDLLAVDPTQHRDQHAGSVNPPSPMCETPG
jgi:hypothetical protein